MAEPITIDDDDVVMVGDLQVLQLKEPFVIDDEDDDKLNIDKTVSTQNISTEETIVLDDDAPTRTEKETTTKLPDNKIEKSFVTNLENNRLLDKIVTRVTTMENATGMHRVVQKTLLPLYRDANNRFKESDEFRTMLKKTYKLLMKDPDHKFLHIKTLCEELKSGGLRRKVPFVTLATNTKKNGFETDYRDLTSSSKEMDRNKNNNVEITPIPEINRKNYITQKKRKKIGKGKKRGTKKKKVTPTRAPIETRSCVIVTQTEKTDVIELDDSETESQGEDDPKNDVIFVDVTDQKNDIPNTLLKEPLEVPQEFDKVLKVRLEDCNKENQAIQKDSLDENKMIQENQVIQKDSHNENKMIQENQVKQKDSHSENNKMEQENQVIQKDSHIEKKLVQEIQVTQKDSQNENKLAQENQVIQKDSHNENRMIQPTLEENIYKNNIVTKSTLEKDSDKQNLLTNTQKTFPIELNKRNTLLVPTMGNAYTAVPATAENVNVPPIVANIYDRQGKLIGVEIESELSKQYKRTQPIITNYAENGNPVIIDAFSYKENTEPQATDTNTQNKMLLESELSKQYNRTQPIIKYYAANGNPVIIEAFSYKENTEPQATDTNTQNKVLLESELTKQYKRTQPLIKNYAENGNPVIIGAFSYKENTEPQATDTNKQNKVLQDTEDTAKNGRSSNNETDYDLLIPQTCLALVPNRPVEPKMDVVLKPVTVLPGHITVGSGPVLVGSRPVVVGPVPVTVVYEPAMEVCKPVKEVEQDNRSQNAIAQLEMRIADLKKCVDILEETEVTSESYHGSAYYICSKYKEDIVQSYKRICQLKGDSQALVKKRQIRLQVTEGHPPGPAKRLEDLLNRSINSRGEVPFPSFPEVLKCVVDADLYDNLYWDRHTIMQEAVALFRQCGQALRKRRQQREYKDLLSLIRNEEETDDPAEKDPILLAKLEENKQIALKKEEEILDRYVAMEQNPNMYATEFHSDKNCSDSDSECEQNIPSAGESSRNTIDNVSILPNNVNAPPNSTSNHSNEGPSSSTNILVSNLVVTPTLVTTSDSSNPMLMTYLLNAPAPPQKLENYMNENPPSIRDRLIMVDDSNEDSYMSESEETDFSDNEEKFNIETELTVTDTTVGFNNESSKTGDLTSSGRISNIENENLTTNNQPCNINDSADGIKQNCDSSISTEGASVKTEDRVKTEPVDVQNMFDELGDGFVCQVFDIEDPFLVIEISSDESSDDEEL